eukprot:gb/GEZN01004555.1/.p1 GENE.gb/GEZN01004555.1/~~gb/GEZN01004555.1/.p1  ORF type:complete len:151 (+),score=18.51 gb/GEZN01004555.1/:92-544(+)
MQIYGLVSESRGLELSDCEMSPLKDWRKGSYSYVDAEDLEDPDNTEDEAVESPEEDSWEDEEKNWLWRSPEGPPASPSRAPAEQNEEDSSRFLHSLLISVAPARRTSVPIFHSHHARQRKWWAFVQLLLVGMMTTMTIQAFRTLPPLQTT